MKDAPPTRAIDAPKADRSARGAAAVVAQYIHDLSGRHALPRHGIRRFQWFHGG